MGARSVKFYPDPNSVSRFQSNDIPIFRLADVYLMQARIHIAHSNGSMTTAQLTCSIKSRRRAKAPEVTTITLQDILDERGRELAWEGWRRTDLIRYGRYENAWGFKTGSESIKRRLYPIPALQKLF